MSEAKIGKRLKAARETRGFTKRVVARQLGVSLVTLSGWEDGLTDPRRERIERIEKFIHAMENGRAAK